nr:tail tubular protein B [Methylophilales phage MEP433]WOZ55713.1 tail tubular protein B [Methylophilales phage MEP434]
MPYNKAAQSLVAQSIPNFINGISQQTPTQRGINQGEEQINLQNNIVDGLSRRPPLEYIATMDSSNVFPNTTKMWSIQKDATQQYFAAFYNGGIRVFDLQGNEKTVTIASGSSYLATTDPKNDFKLVNIADYTFVANKSITPTAAATSSAAKVEEFLIYVKSTNYGREYTVTLTHPDIAYGIKVVFQLPSGNDATTDSAFRDTNKIKDILLYGTSSTYWDSAASQIAFKTIRTDTGATLSTSQGLANYSEITAEFTFESYDNVIYGKPTDGNSAYTVSTSDGSGNTAMYHVRDSIQDFTQLPFHAKLNMIIKITGDEGDTLSDYFVNYTGDGVWEETIAPSTNNGVDTAKMPHALINNNDGTFTFQELQWTGRTCGDSDTNPDPTFIGKTIQNLTFYKNRLGILAGENLILTENADFFNFFATTVTQVLDTDPIDIAASGTNVTTLKNSVSFNETLLLFSNTAQYKLDHAGAEISPTTAILNEVSSFEHDESVTPVSAGKFAYFAQKRNNNTAIREYYADDDTLTNDGLDITVSVQNLLPTNPYQIISNTVEDTLIFLHSDIADNQTAPYVTPTDITATNADTMFIYKYFFDRGEKVQTAWSKWIFENVKIIGGLTTESHVYLFVNEKRDTKLVRIDLRNLEEPALGFNVHIDLKKAVTGTYDSATDLTTLTTPYGAKTGLIAVDGTNGTDYELTYVSGSNYTLVGDHTSLIIGIPFASTYTLSPQYIRETTAKGLLSVTTGRYQLRTISFEYENSGFFEIQTDLLNRDSYTKTMTGYVIGFTGAPDRVPLSTGTFRVPIQCRNTDCTVHIKSSSHLPFHILSAEVEGYYQRRSQRL